MFDRRLLTQHEFTRKWAEQSLRENNNMVMNPNGILEMLDEIDYWRKEALKEYKEEASGHFFINPDEMMRKSWSKEDWTDRYLQQPILDEAAEIPPGVYEGTFEPSDNPNFMVFNLKPAVKPDQPETMISGRVGIPVIVYDGARRNSMVKAIRKLYRAHLRKRIREAGAWSIHA